MASRVDLLRWQLAEAFRRMHARLAGLSDREFFWEPVEGCWTVRRDQSGRWAADYPELPHPEPSPFTTIAWRLVHVVECKMRYHEYAFGDARLTWPEIDSAHTAADAVAQFEQGHQRLLDDLLQLDDAGLEQSVPTNWGDHWPAWRIFWAMVDHDIHHGAEIATLRDLYRICGHHTLCRSAVD